MDNFVIFETHCFTISQASGYRIPGYIIIHNKLNYTQLTDFTPEQLNELMQCIAKAESILQKLTRPERIYVLKFAEENPLIHFHVVPRTEKMAKAYFEKTNDSRSIGGARIMEWLWHNHNSLGYSNQEIASFIVEARKLIK